MITVRHLSSAAVGAGHPDYPVTDYDRAVASMPVDWALYIDPEWAVMDDAVPTAARFFPNLATPSDPVTRKGYAHSPGEPRDMTTFDNGVPAMAFAVPRSPLSSIIAPFSGFNAAAGTWLFVIALTNDGVTGSQGLAVSSDLAVLLRSDRQLTVYKGGAGGTVLAESATGISYAPAAPQVVLVGYSAERGVTIRIDGVEAARGAWTGPLAGGDAGADFTLLQNFTGRVGAVGYLPDDLTRARYATALARMEAFLMARYSAA